MLESSPAEPPAVPPLPRVPLSSAVPPSPYIPPSPHIPPLPARPRRRRIPTVRLLVATAILLAVIAAGAVELARSSAEPQPFYTGMPAPCTMIAQPAMRIKDMAEPQGGLVQTSAQKQTGICYWNAFTAKGNPAMLELEVDLYRSAAKAQQSYDSVAQTVADGWAPQGVTASAWSAPGLGDQAIGQVQTGVPQTGEATAEVWVQSGNAEVWIAFYSGDWHPSTAETVEMQSVTAMARHVLAALHKRSST
jgi:hypothetical protein